MATAIKQTGEQGELASLLEASNDKLLTCVHCGLCLPSCPTYRQLGNENDSPRGRIYLMRGVVEGKISASDSFISHIDLCLGCRACETACPSSVPYGHLLEAARVEVAQAKRKRGSLSEYVTRFFLNQIFTRPSLFGFCMTVARWLRDSGAAQLAFETNLVGGRFRYALALLLSTRSALAKSASRRNAHKELRGDEPALPDARRAEKSLRVALLEGCVMEGLFKETNRATGRVLSRNGCELVSAEGQMCCGALHAHAGQIESAKRLARENIEAFLRSGCDRVITNAAGCGAAMKEYPALLAGDAQFADKAREFSAKVRDVSEFLAEIGIARPENPVARRVAYDAPCHLIHAQRIAEAPLDVLRAIPGLTLAPLKGFETCCGGAGIYNLQHPELSADILREKIESIRESKADTVATGNPGCIMQIGAGALLANLKVDVAHPVELLDQAYSEGE
jgi:glycolate oxidase iron-sulfur subunit